jgi:hypothetical protein
MSERPNLSVLRGGAGSSTSHRPRGPLGAALAAASAWLIEPAEPPQAPELALPTPSRPVIAVFGLARGCGGTVVSRALAAEGARRGLAGAGARHSEVRASGIPLATPAASELAKTLADVPGADTRAVGRLCLVGGATRDALAETARYLAPLVIDAGATALGGAPAALADRVVVVTTPAVEPALAGVAAECLRRVGQEPIVVLNRAGGGASAVDRLAAHRLPDSRMGAQLALGGREPRGELGRGIAELADLCER